MRSRAYFLLALLLFALAAAGIWYWQSRRPLEPGRLRLEPVAFSDLPGWAQNDPRPAAGAFRRSCKSLMKNAGNAAMGGAGYAGTFADWQGPCRALPNAFAGAASARGFFESWFRPVAVRAGDAAEGLFTGYYEPELRGSLTRRGAYRIPVYGLPKDLISVDLGQFRESLRGEQIAGRLKGQSLVPYPTRAQIDAAGLPAAPVLFYGDDPVAVFFLHIQGSGRVRLDDGRMIRAAYAGKNGRPYTPIGRTLIRNGALSRDEVSLQTIRAWLKSHPDRAPAVMESDASYVFFQQQPIGDAALGSAGAEGVALTPQASLAVDLRLHPLGAPFFIAADVPSPAADKPDRPFHALLIAQDTGGAITGPVRGDVYWGFGPVAQAVAGRMKAKGKLYVLLPKAVAQRLTDFAAP